MAPGKNKKKVGAASKSETKNGVSGMKRLKKGLKTVTVSKSSSEEVVSEKKLTEDKKDGDAAKESLPTPTVKPVKKPCSWLKLDRLNPPTGNKSSLESGKEGKEAKMTTQVEASKDNKRKRNEKPEEKGHQDSFREKQIDSRHEKKEKGIINDRHEDAKRDDESNRSLGGLIFMCNAKTKPDCFRYQLMGVPVSKKEVVMNIKLGLKIFLYDYELKLMYGVFEASSAGGMKLEPAAFGGAFPAQVRYTVYKDCLPLPESVFKKAIKDSYDERTRKFKTELTVKQVKNLIDLFRPTPLLYPNGGSVVEESVMRQRNLNNSDTRGLSIPSHHENQFSDFHDSVRQDPLFLTEQEYRNNGLRHGRSLLPTTAGDNGGSVVEESVTRQINPNNSDTRGMSIPSHHENQFSNFHNSVHQDPLFLTEQEYRNNGLRHGRSLLPTTAGDNVGHSWEPNKLDGEIKKLLRNPDSTTDPAVQQREFSRGDPYFHTEREYHTYGLRGPHQAPNAVPPIMTNNSVARDSSLDAYDDPYGESTTSLVNRYLSMPVTTAAPPEPYSNFGRERYVNDHPARIIPDGEGASVPYDPREPSLFNQRSYSLSALQEPSKFNREASLQYETVLTSAPVSNRYSFVGPSVSQHR